MLYPSTVPQHRSIELFSDHDIHNSPWTYCFDCSVTNRAFFYRMLRDGNLQGENSQETSKASTTNASRDGVSSTGSLRSSGASLADRRARARCACIDVSLEPVL